MRSSSLRFRRLLARAMAAAVFGSAIPCRAGECPVEVTGEQSVPWQQATRELAASQLTDRDCASIHVDITDEGTRVTFITPDGRRAERSRSRIRLRAELALDAVVMKVSAAFDSHATTPWLAIAGTLGVEFGGR